MKRTLFVALVGLLAFSGCRKKAGNNPASVSKGDENVPSAPVEVPTKPAKPGKFDPGPLPPPDAELTPAMESRFRSNDPKQPFAPPQSGDIQAQLDLYNRVLRKWTVAQGYTPDTLKDLQASYGTPKPPKPPAGRTLVYDRKTVTVSLQ